MPEDLNRDPLLGKMARMRPTTAGIDRDEMLFAAGRASAPRTSGWKLAFALLALSQAVTLTLWLAGSHAERPAAITAQPEGPVAPSSSAVEPMSPESYGGLVSRWHGEELPPSPPVGDPFPPHPVLSVAGSRGMLAVD